MLPQNKPDRIRILFDDHRLVANAGLILPATLALRLGLPQLLWVLLFRAGFCSKTIIPDSEEHPLASSWAVLKAVIRWIRA